MWAWLRGLRVIEKDKTKKVLGGCPGAVGCSNCHPCNSCGVHHVCVRSCYGGDGHGSSKKQPTEEEIIKKHEQKQRDDFNRAVTQWVFRILIIALFMVVFIPFAMWMGNVRDQETYQLGYDAGFSAGKKKGLSLLNAHFQKKYNRCVDYIQWLEDSGTCFAADASKFYRDSPSADVPLGDDVPFDDDDTDDYASPDIVVKAPAGYAQDGLPDACKSGNTAKDCVNRERMLACTDQAKYYFNRGEAEMAVGKIDAARSFFFTSIKIGRQCGSEYAVLSAKRLSALNLTCEYTTESLARISRGYEKNPEGGDIIDLRIRQQALKALGHYDGDVDNAYGPGTREAIKKFQREFGFSETGDLTPIETVYVVCAAAQNASDVRSINVLGIMYIAGLGVVQNTDIGLRWLKLAATRGDGDALFNLAIIYGSGTVLSSYKICGIVENEEIADAFLWEAAEKDHRIARVLINRYGRLAVAERWKQIREKELEQTSAYNARLRNVGVGCEPNG